MRLLRALLIHDPEKRTFQETYKRLSHIEKGHPFDLSVRLDKLHSEKHPHTDDECVYTVNIMRCEDCGLIWLDKGMEWRNKQ